MPSVTLAVEALPSPVVPILLPEMVTVLPDPTSIAVAKPPNTLPEMVLCEEKM